MILTQDERDYLLDAMSSLLTTYSYEHTDDALNKIIDEWAEQKKDLIEGFRKHPSYVEGKFLIAFNHKYERLCNIDALYNFSNWLDRYALREVTAPDDILARKEIYCTYLPDKLWIFLINLDRYNEQYLSSETAQMLREAIPEVKPRAKQKMSRVVNKICTYLGYDKIEGFNKEFAKYADALNPITLERKVILSINPLDYLTMSFGNSWSSCHTIDRNNIRRMPNGYRGQYSSGTISYMLDPSSMVMYTVDASYSGNDYSDQPKINRQMFHYGQDKLVQSRLYPQSNDSGSIELYNQYRNIVQLIVSTMFGFPNLWALKHGTDSTRRWINTRGTHYADYVHFNNCSISTIKGSENENLLTVGSTPICVKCGDRHHFGDTITCCDHQTYTCTECGCVVDEDDVTFVNGEPYCNDCVYYCDDCDEYVLETYTVYDAGGERYVCEHCRDNYYTLCSKCHEYVHEDCVRYIESVDKYVCDECLREHFFYCEECEEYHLKAEMHCHDGKPVCKSCFDYFLEKEAQNERG